MLIEFVRYCAILLLGSISSKGDGKDFQEPPLLGADSILPRFYDYYLDEENEIETSAHPLHR